ncbi:transcriptional regulator [Halobacteriales archaeon QS_1_68_20]|nr:MAG: transcriptional regulator [Halobacteriales archaeon QS_1_68_20]
MRCLRATTGSRVAKERPGVGPAVSDAPTLDERPECFCPASDVVEILSRKYAMQIVCVVGAHDGVRFGEIEARVPGASTSTVAARLQAFRDAGLVDRTQYAEIPPRVEYELTEDGREACERLEPLVEWARSR